MEAAIEAGRWLRRTGRISLPVRSPRRRGRSEGRGLGTAQRISGEDSGLANQWSANGSSLKAGTSA
jgi:hypothetical protein